MIKYAVNEHRDWISADSPNVPPIVHCAHCDAPMHARKIPGKQIRTFVLFSGGQHMYAECRKMADAKSIYDLRRITPTDIIHTYLDPIKPEGKSVGDPTPSPFDPPKSLPVGGSPEGGDQSANERMRGIRTLPELHVSGLLDCKDREMEGGWTLSELTINPHYNHMLIDLDRIGKRILRCQSPCCYDDSRKIRFRIYIYDDGKGKKLKQSIKVDTPPVTAASTETWILQRPHIRSSRRSCRFAETCSMVTITRDLLTAHRW